MRTQRTWPSLLLMMGSILWIVGVNALLGSEWGPPGTAAYERYQWANRLFALPPLLFLCGNIGVHRSVSKGGDRFSRGTLALVSVGYGTMIVGSVAEFWLFTRRSYTDPFRNASWAIFLIGVLIFLIAMVLHGIAMWWSGDYPRWLALITILVALVVAAGLVLTNTIFVMGLSIWATALAIWYLWSTRTSRQLL